MKSGEAQLRALQAAALNRSLRLYLPTMGAESSAAFRAPPNCSAPTSGARTTLFLFGQIERTGRWVHACHQYIERTALVLYGSDGHPEGGRDGDPALWISGSHLFTPAVRFCRVSLDHNSIG